MKMILISSLLLSLTLIQAEYITHKAHSTNSHTADLVLTTHKDYGTVGYLAVISNPVNHFRVYFSSFQNGTCGDHEKTSRIAAARGCLYATNGGPFDMTSADSCQGLIVSNGQVVLDQNPKGKASFGLTKDGYFAIGDIRPEDLRKVVFDQLLTGFDLLLKNGVNVAGKSDFVAPRTAIGFDKEGRLYIFEADGVEKDFPKPIGLTLHQTAEWFKKLGVYNALNLDGGGSSVTFFNGTVVSVPTCGDVPIKCERPVTTITCVM